MSEDLTVLDTLYWWGVPSLFRCPVDPDPANTQIALAGVPHSSGNGSTERDQHLGPRAVRNVSAHNRRIHKAYGFSPWETCTIRDVGDVPLPEGMDNELCVERISAFFKAIAGRGRAAGVDRRRPRHHGRDRAGHRRRRLAAHRRPPGGAAAPRCAHRLLRPAALERRHQVGGELGRLPGAPGQRRSVALAADRHARQPADADLAAAELRPRLRGGRDGALPRDRARRDAAS